LSLFVLFFLLPRPAATVTLTPITKTVSGPVMSSYTPRTVSFEQQKLGTGVPLKAGMRARGTLTFQNYTLFWVTIPQGTIVTGVTGQQVVTEQTIRVPPDPIIPGIASVVAQSLKVGKNGNIPAMSIDKPYSSGVLVFNSAAFSGGVDEQVAHTVQQSDIDRVAQPLVASLSQKALTGLEMQLKPDEQLVKTTPTCASPVVASDPGVGASTESFTVNVALTCTDSAYNPRTIPTPSQESLKQLAAQQLSPGSAFSLVGDITLIVEQETPDKSGVINVLVSASGMWAYQFTAAARLAMAKHIARATVSDAMDWLLKQPGVMSISISVSGPIFDLSGAGVLPDDLRAITING
jgi:hypothetical protein